MIEMECLVFTAHGYTACQGRFNPKVIHSPGCVRDRNSASNAKLKQSVFVGIGYILLYSEADCAASKILRCAVRRHAAMP